MSKIRMLAFCLAVLLTTATCGFTASAQAKRPLVSQVVDEVQLVTLLGNTRAEVKPSNDRGPVADTLALEHMYLQLKRSPEQQQAVDELIDRLPDRWPDDRLGTW